MQDRYVGDIGDYGKLGLLRSLAAAGLRIGEMCIRDSTPSDQRLSVLRSRLLGTSSLLQ